LNTVK